MPGTATYVYCVVHRAKPPRALRPPGGVPGGSRPRVDGIASRLWLVSAEVPLSEYDAGQIRGRLQDLDWVSGIALAHESVVERFSRMAGTTVIPMKLFTLFASVERAVETMRSRRDQLERIAKRLRDADEWGLRITRRATAPGTKPQRLATASSGAAFLASKKRARDEAQARASLGIAAAERALAALERFAREARRQLPPEGATSPPVVLAALLVPSNRKVRFRAAVRREAQRCSAAGADLTLTGPWPAYNFVAEE